MTDPRDTRAPVNVFVSASGNRFMRDLADVIVEAATSTRRATLVEDRLPEVDGSINLVVAPHEFFELTDAPTRDLQRAAAASVCIGTEQPGTPWFRLTSDVARRGLRSFDINAVGVAAMRQQGIDTRRLQLGAVPSMSASDDRERRIDVLVLGGLDERRGAILADLAPRLYRRNAELRLLRFDRPVTEHTPGAVFGAAKYGLLADSKVLLNLHRDRGPGLPAYFEWVRMVEAMANRCVVLSEPSVEHAPLVAGTHFVEAPVARLADDLDAVLADGGRRTEIAGAAHDVVTGQLALAPTLGRLLDDAEREVLPRLPEHVASGRFRHGQWTLHRETTNPVRRLEPMQPYAEPRRTAKRLALEDGALLRRIDALRCVVAHGTEMFVERRASPSFAAARVDVSVIVTLYGYADIVTGTLDSIAASEDVAFELIVVDDHSPDDGRAVVSAWMDEHSDIPALLLGKNANEGLASARNSGFTEARAPYVMVLDADNLVYPTALARLAETLDRDPTAAAAYSILEDFGDQRGLRSAYDWDPQRLCAANYLDAQSMWRATDWWRLGGYRPSDDTHGWEDWDLWLRLAQIGGHAVLRREILGRYRVRGGSMIGLTNLALDDPTEAMRARYPALPWPADR